MNKSRFAFRVCIPFLFLVYCLADQFWDRKPYTGWKSKECEKLLNDSPWSYPYGITVINIPGAMNQSGGTTPSRSFGDGDLTGVRGDREVLLFLRIRFVTAKPVKAAIGRMRMLSDPDNQQLAGQVAQYVNQPDGEEVVIELTYYSEPQGHLSLRQIESYLRAATLPKLEPKVYLSNSARHIHVPISRYQPPHEGYNGALLFFPRFDAEGTPYFDGTENEILFHMEIDIAEVNLRLKPDKMVFNDAFAL